MPTTGENLGQHHQIGMSDPYTQTQKTPGVSTGRS